MLFFQIILPAIAIGYFIWFAYRPFIGAIGLSRLEQSVLGDASSIARLASERGQRDMYDSAIALGFTPLGVYRETDWVFDDAGEDEYILTHSELPILCALCSNVNNERFIVLSTVGQNGRLVRSSSSSAGVEFDNVHGFAQRVDAKNFEQMLTVHALALGVWKEKGFQAVAVKTVSDVEAHQLSHSQNPNIRGTIRLIYVVAFMALFFACVVLPIGLLLVAPNVIDISASLSVQIASAISMLFTYSVRRSTQLLSKNLSTTPPENSLGHNGESAVLVN